MLPTLNTQDSIHGRGAADNPPNRFEAIHLERDEDWDPREDPAPRTQFFRDLSSTVINYNDSPDIGFNASINPYRGCEHGCIYCYARPFHEFLGFSAGLDFETRIMVKQDAPELLRRELSSKKWKPQIIAMSGVTDCYQPAERRFKITRGCLEVLAEFRNPVSIVTKNHLVTRDIDVLTQLARYNATAVFVSITTLDASLATKMEPRTSLPELRLDAIRKLSEAGIPTGVMTAPIIPALNDHELPRILKRAAEAGARFAGCITLRLPFAVAGMFEQWLSQHFPDQKKNVLNRIRSIRGGKLNDGEFGSRMRGEGLFADQIQQLFEVGCRKAGIDPDAGPELSTGAFRRSAEPQLTLFD